MKRKIIFTVAWFLNVSVWAGTPIKIVTTLTDLKSIAETIGGNKVDVFAIATGFQNPHFVDPKPSYIMKLAKADMFITVGLDLETGWAPSLLSSSRNEKIQKGSDGYVDASTDIPLLQVPTSVNRGEGDIHIFGNPHYWLDPVRAKTIAQTICNALIRVSPENAKEFENNLQQFKSQIDVRLKDWLGRMTPFKGAKVIAYHNEWVYFEQRFGLQIVDFLEPKPGIPPSSNQLAKVIGEIKRDNIRAIISSPYFSVESADLVARQTGAHVAILATSVAAEESIKNYFDLIDYNVNALIKALQ